MFLVLRHDGFVGVVLSVVRCPVGRSAFLHPEEAGYAGADEGAMVTAALGAHFVNDCDVERHAGVEFSNTGEHGFEVSLHCFCAANTGDEVGSTVVNKNG